MRVEELSHIVISVVTISLAFAIDWTGSTEFTSLFAGTFLLILATVGSGFILHELAHKYVAQKYGAFAEYRSWTIGLGLAVAMAVFTGFVFAAPGAVYIFGNHLTREQNGRIALAGPLTNAFLVLAFVAVGILAPHLAGLAKTGASVNAFLGFFNLLPFFPMDGQKVFAWNSSVWLASIAGLFLLMTFAGAFF